jgi:ribosome-associated translation inhibitor RaiA
MKVDIVSTGLPFNEEFEKLTSKKFTSLEKIYNHITGCEIILKENEGAKTRSCEIEGRVLIAKSCFFCREQAETFEMALNQVVENLARQLRSEKEGRVEIW